MGLLMSILFGTALTHLIAPERQGDETFAFAEVLMLADHQLIKCV